MKPRPKLTPKRMGAQSMLFRNPHSIVKRKVLHLKPAGQHSRRKPFVYNKHNWFKVETVPAENEYSERDTSESVLRDVEPVNNKGVREDPNVSDGDSWSTASVSDDDTNSGSADYLHSQKAMGLSRNVPTLASNEDSSLESDKSDDEDSSDKSDSEGSSSIEEIEETKNFWLFDSQQSDMAVLVLRHPCQVVLSGCLQLRALSGYAEMHGWHLSPDISSQLGFVSVFSSQQYGRLAISTIGPERLPKSVKLKKHLACRLASVSAKHLLPSVMSVATTDCIVVAMNKLDMSRSVQYATNMLSPTVLSPQRGPSFMKRLGFSICRDTQGALFVTQQHRQIAEQVNYAIQYARSLGAPAPRIVVCGDRNTGKSTFVRFLINSALSLEVCSSVYHLDLDPGQTEFSPSSCLNLTKVDCPLLGPPFTHQKTPVKQCFVGGPSVENTPDLFCESLNHLLTYYDSTLSSEPLIVNTMGWSRGLGLALLVDVLRMSRPNLVIQMDSMASTLPPISSEFLAEECGWRSTRAKYQPSRADIEFKMVRTSNDTEPSKTESPHPGLSAPLKRSLSALAYLGRMIKGGTLTEVQPACVPWSEVAIMLTSKVSLKQEDLLEVLNGSWVALCCVSTSQVLEGIPSLPKLLKSPSNFCVGYGLVRAIDLDQEVILILTPEPLSRIQKVNALAIMGEILPSEVYTTQETEGPVPYVSQTLVTSKLGLGIKMKQTRKEYIK